MKFICNSLRALRPLFPLCTLVMMIMNFGVFELPCVVIALTEDREPCCFSNVYGLRFVELEC